MRRGNFLPVNNNLVEHGVKIRVWMGTRLKNGGVFNEIASIWQELISFVEHGAKIWVWMGTRLKNRGVFNEIAISWQE